jgi:hypothetical protein
VTRELVASRDISRSKAVSFMGYGFTMGEYGALTPTRTGWLAVWALTPPETTRAADVYAIKVSPAD